MQKHSVLLLFTVLFSITLNAQQPKKPNASEIFESIKKLNFLGSVLYVAAHPDDENTRLISYLANKVHARTAYLSLTRGDGGQNLIGPEIRELLGVIRTQELLAARRIDGGTQRFTRANDFGYSKHPDETLAIWNKNEVLSDVVLAIRQFKPDVIINRFDHRSPGSTHGHHTSSAMLSFEAFDVAGNPNRYPEQVENYGTWQPKREFFNTSWWFYGSQEKFDAADKTNLLNVDVGVFYPSSGLSNTEIASLSRSQHKSQGFGNTGTRGSQTEYIELIKGDLPKDKSNLFDGVNTTWTRVEGGNQIGDILQNVEKNYNFKNPSASIPELIKAYKLINQLDDKHWKAIKLEEIKSIIYACSGLYLEAVADTNHATPNSDVNVTLEVINRNDSPVTLKDILLPNNTKVDKNIVLTGNTDFQFKETLKIPNDAKTTTPYWLEKPGTLGMYNVENKALIGLAETPREYFYIFNLEIENTLISYKKPVVFKLNDPVKGEVYKPFEIIPKASVKLTDKVIVFSNNEAKVIPVTVTSGITNLSGSVSIEAPNDWTVTPKSQMVSIANKGQQQTVLFTITPPKNNSEAIISPKIIVDNQDYTKELIEVDYDHIPYQTILLPSESKVVKLNIEKKGSNIAYIEGAGDVVPESLRQIGYSVTILDPSDITATNLENFDAVVMGIRAYNTIDELKFKQDILLDFVKNGGNMIVQYNTSHRLKLNQLAPYDLKLSRDRVTDEFAEVRFLDENHPVLNSPNKITSKDFEGWTQERGLYFPDEWAKEFSPILSMNDKDESPKTGSLLVAPYGKGYYIYTGLSFFREFPAGVSGAYKLFANLLSIGK
jgi:LmbE family N-acetylglucosaminyl deacetylase